MKFKRIYKKKDEINVIYIRFKWANLKGCNYVGQTINILNGRPFRFHAYGGSNRGSSKWQSIIVLRCPSSRLDVREAYFILKYRPTTMKIHTYFKKAWHLLKKNEMMFLLTKYILLKNHHSPADWKIISGEINKIGKTKDQKEHYSILRNLRLSAEHKKVERPKTDEQKIKSGELLDPTSTIKQQTIWAKNFCKKFFGEEFKGFKNSEKGMF